MRLEMINGLLPLLFLLYQIIIDSIDLFPFNDVKVRDKRLRKLEILGNYPPLVVISICFFLDYNVSVWIGFVLTAIIFVMHLFAWWIPYFFGVPQSVRADYDCYFSRTYKFLPRIKDHIIPDAEHCGVGVLLLITLCFQIMRIF